MDDLTIKKDGKVIFDSQGSTLTTDGVMEIIEPILNNTLYNKKCDNVVNITIKSTPKSSIEQMELSKQV
jgi:hypothetical protein